MGRLLEQLSCVRNQGSQAAMSNFTIFVLTPDTVRQTYIDTSDPSEHRRQWGIFDYVFTLALVRDSRTNYTVALSIIIIFHTNTGHSPADLHRHR